MSKRERAIKEQENRLRDEQDYQKAVVHNTYFNKRDEQIQVFKERQRKIEEFQKAASERYIQQVDSVNRERMMRETFR